MITFSGKQKRSIAWVVFKDIALGPFYALFNSEAKQQQKESLDPEAESLSSEYSINSGYEESIEKVKEARASLIAARKAKYAAAGLHRVRRAILMAVYIFRTGFWSAHHILSKAQNPFASTAGNILLHASKALTVFWFLRGAFGLLKVRRKWKQFKPSRDHFIATGEWLRKKKTILLIDPKDIADNNGNKEFVYNDDEITPDKFRRTAIWNVVDSVICTARAILFFFPPILPMAIAFNAVYESWSFFQTTQGTISLYNRFHKEVKADYPNANFKERARLIRHDPLFPQKALKRRVRLTQKWKKFFTRGGIAVGWVIVGLAGFLTPFPINLVIATAGGATLVIIAFALNYYEKYQEAKLAEMEKLAAEARQAAEVEVNFGAGVQDLVPNIQDGNAPAVSAVADFAPAHDGSDGSEEEETNEKQPLLTVPKIKPQPEIITGPQAIPRPQQQAITATTQPSSEMPDDAIIDVIADSADGREAPSPPPETAPTRDRRSSSTSEMISVMTARGKREQPSPVKKIQQVAGNSPPEANDATIQALRAVHKELRVHSEFRKSTVRVLFEDEPKESSINSDGTQAVAEIQPEASTISAALN